MAVQDGYGKVSGSESLVFAFDLKDTINSYRGEPTTNICNNADFSTPISGTAGGTFGGWTFGSWDSSNSHETVTDTYNGETINALKITLGSYPAHFFSSNWGTETIPGRTYTWTNLMKGTPGQVIQMYSHWGNLLTVTLTGEWQEFSTTFVRGGSLGLYMYYNPSHTAVGNVIYVARVQVEEKSHKTPFTISSRNDSDSLKDLTGNNTINIPAVSFDSSASMVFDGTNDYILLPSTYTTFSNRPKREITVLMVLKFNNFNGQQEIMRTGGAIEFDVGEVGGDGSGRMSFWIYDSGWQSTDYDIKTNVGTNTWFMVTGVYSNITNRHELYVNGNLVSNGGVGGQSGLDLGGTGSTFIGAASTGALFFNGEIKVCQIYNKPLTSTEISNNYLKYKRQYGLT